jgi:hypothetical protein
MPIVLWWSHLGFHVVADPNSVGSHLLTCNLSSLTDGELAPWSTIQEGALHAPLRLCQIYPPRPHGTAPWRFFSQYINWWLSLYPVEVWFRVQASLGWATNQSRPYSCGQSKFLCGLGTWSNFFMWPWNLKHFYKAIFYVTPFQVFKF